MKLALLFPGQGSQVVGMGRDVAEASAAAREVYARADAALGVSISTMCFEGPDSSLVLTANTQPALVATSSAIWAALNERVKLPAPFCAAGHSLGEYSALVAAGALTVDDAVKLVRVRGEAMQRAVPPGHGAMAAIMGLAPEVVVEVCEAAAREGEPVSPANFNGTQIVIAGAAAAVKRASDDADARKGKVIPLNVSAPFHCALMRPAANELAPHLERVVVGEMSFPVVANFDAVPNQDPTRVRGLLLKQIDGVVRWEQTVRWMADNGVTHALEVGPGKVLAGLVRRIAKGLVVLPCADIASIDEAAATLAKA
ncbi:MAG: ACP S-malonyltransferase [Polyangiaceae bacterium]